MNKRVDTTTIIGGADGPTSIFLAGKQEKTGLGGIRQLMKSRRYEHRRKKTERRIAPGSHTIEELAEYMVAKYGAVELKEDRERFRFQRKSCKAGLVQKYAPELAGVSWEITPPEWEDKEAVLDFLRKVDEQQERAASVPEESFPMDYHIFHICVEGCGEIYMEMEKIRGYLSETCSAEKGKMKYVKKVVKDIRMFYGVTSKDIEERSERYQYLLGALME